MAKPWEMRKGERYRQPDHAGQTQAQYGDVQARDLGLYDEVYGPTPPVESAQRARRAFREPVSDDDYFLKRLNEREGTDE